jgi:hypothetical protein
VQQFKGDGGTVVFPCRDHHGDLVSGQRRDLLQTDLEGIKKRWPEGHKQWTFGADDFNPLQPLVLVEGAIDWLLCRAMHMNVVGLPSATFKVENAEWLDRFDECEEWVVLDEGGSAATKMFKALGGSRYADRIHVFTLDRRDIYDIWKREDLNPVATKAVIEAAIAERRPLADYLRPSGWEDLHSTERIRTIRWGSYTWTAQYTPNEYGGKVDLRITDDEGNLKRPDSITPTGTGVETASKALDKSGLVPVGQSSLGVLEEIVYGLLASHADSQSAIVNLLTIEDDEDEDEGSLLNYPLVPFDASGVLVGPSGSTKTMTAIAQALVLASGQRVGLYETSSQPVPLLYLDGEWTRRDVREIAYAVGRAHDIDVAELEGDGLISYERITAPIIGRAEQYRRLVEARETGLIIVDSLDTARGADALNLSGEYFDVLRYIGISSLSIDHVPVDLADQPMSKFRSYGSVRAINRPRQTWAIKASPLKGGVVPIKLRLNYVNRGQVGLMMGYDLRFEMRGDPKRGQRFHEIHFSDPTVIKEEPPTNEEMVLIALHRLDGATADVSTLISMTGLAENQVSKAKSGCRGKKKLWVTPKDKPLALETAGRNRLSERWPDGEYPDPKEGNE